MKLVTFYQTHRDGVQYLILYPLDGGVVYFSRSIEFDSIEDAKTTYVLDTVHVDSEC